MARNYTVSIALHDKRVI